MQLSMTPISAATSASWQHPVESCYAAKSNTVDPDSRMTRSLPTCRVSTCSPSSTCSPRSPCN